MDSPIIAIITGLSGAGRTSAAKVLEDLGYFVIDNMPPSLLTSVLSLAQTTSITKIALVVDPRGKEFFSELDETLQDLRSSGVGVTLLYLEAKDTTLVRRFEAERRVHPMAGDGRILDGIENEREVLANTRTQADVIIDTSELTIHQLRDRLQQVFSNEETKGMVTNIVSFGFKHGIPQDLDLLFDVRFLPNPHWVPELRPLVGTDKPVRDYVLGKPEAQEFLEKLYDLLDVMFEGFHKEGKRYMTIGIGCTGGNHRSVALAEEIGAHLRDRGENIRTRHRDRERR